MKLERIHIPLPTGAYGIGNRSPQQNTPAAKVAATGDHSQKRGQNTPYSGRKPGQRQSSPNDEEATLDSTAIPPTPEGEHDDDRVGSLDITV